MRCKNCGWPNEPNASKCVKCNAPLSVGASMPEAGRQSSISSQPSENLKATLRESSMGASMGSSSSFQEPQAPGAQHLDPPFQPSGSEGASGVCPECGYKRSPSTKACPVCGHTFDKTIIDSVPPTPSTGGSEGFSQRSGRFAGTINPWMVPGEESAFCTLQRIPWQTEKVTYEPVSYSGQRIELNRGNTDSNNNSITSRTQAVLTQENGKWYIEDSSEMHTTLIRVSRKMELQDGDVVVLGNRMFEFRKG